jgi:hypothetical protein
MSRRHLSGFGGWGVLDFRAFSLPVDSMVGPNGFELEPLCGREGSGSPRAKSRAQRGTSIGKTPKAAW